MAAWSRGNNTASAITFRSIFVTSAASTCTVTVGTSGSAPFDDVQPERANEAIAMHKTAPVQDARRANRIRQWRSVEFRPVKNLSFFIVQKFPVKLCSVA